MKSKTSVKKCDVLIIGAGVSGIAAAVSAARRGSRVILAENYGFLGGLATSAWVGTIAGAYFITSNGEVRFANEGFVKEFVEELRRNDGLGEIASHNDAVYIPYSPVIFKIVCDNFITSEPNIFLMLHSQLINVTVREKRISSVTVHTKSGMAELQGEISVDCTGDAALSLMAGVPMQKSRELQYPSTMFIVNHVDIEKAKASGPGKLSKIMLHASMYGNLKIPRLNGFFFETGRPGEVIISMTGIFGRENKILDINDPEDLTYAELEGRRQSLICFDLLKRQMPGFESSYLSEIAPQLGIRENRRIEGHYLLSRKDILSGRTFRDGVAWGAWPIELHTEEGKIDWVPLKKGVRYQIPYRCLRPQKIENLLVAGRCISASHEAMGSCRVIGTCLAMGQSAGIIASELASKRLSTSQLCGKHLKNIMQSVVSEV